MCSTWMAKTPVAEIHLLDSDDLDWHNFMRAPGAPTDDEIESRHKGRLDKVAYYYCKYVSLREGIHAHALPGGRLNGVRGVPVGTSFGHGLRVYRPAQGL